MRGCWVRGLRRLSWWWFIPLFFVCSAATPFHEGIRLRTLWDFGRNLNQVPIVGVSESFAKTCVLLRSM
ncbi:hypothetical protein LX36DRAFT_466451 [Colletotrichum falcatum]|nr:hypothetical protein LX36DRAFT_466451 [Colletotrichum falcatum]